MKLKIKKLSDTARTPTYATDGAACFDIYASEVNNVDGMVLHNLPLTCKTGLAFEVPEGHVMLVFSRSGHGFNYDTRLANCVGVIDSDYRGELMVKLTKDTPYTKPLYLDAGDRIAQAMVLPVERVEFEEVSKLSGTKRGTGGLGSTGK